MERPRTIPCPSNQEGCKYYPNCHTSIHHEFPRRDADTPLKIKFGNLAINKIVACRNIHDLLDTLPAPTYPDVDKMKKVIYEK